MNIMEVEVFSSQERKQFAHIEYINENSRDVGKLKTKMNIAKY